MRTPTGPEQPLDGRLETHRQDWEDLSRLDPLWAILSYRRQKFGRWNTDDFLATGERQVSELMQRGDRTGHPAGRAAALDFGCGVGRLAPALAERFGCYVGIDISEGMVERARQLHAGRANCEFATSADGSLGGVAAASPGRFDLVVSYYVLQHLPDPALVAGYLEAFLGLLAPGGLLVVQLPGRISRPETMVHDARRGLYRLLRRSGLDEAFLFRRLHVFPMSMHSVPQGDVVAIIEHLGGLVLDVQSAPWGMGRRNCVYYVTLPSPLPTGVR